jgi:LuxR family maltose regulon positive regulatory protein
MSIPVTRTKIVLPRRRPDLLTRQNLVNLLLDLLDNKLTILAAPAGSGKTSLLVDTTQHTNMPVCWYSLDPLDREFKRFIAYLIASISQVFPNFGKSSTIALQSMSETNIDMDRLVATIVNDAYESIDQHFAIILDDYHFVDDQDEINLFISRFVQDVDENCHVVISSRTLLSLPNLPLLVARSQVGGLGFDELAFRAEEIRKLLEQNYHVAVPQSVAEELAHETEGWITGLLLSTQTMWQGMTDRLRVARVSNVGLYEYLAQQVLDQQSATVRDFLLRTSFLEEFDEELVQAVLGSPEYPGGESWKDLIDLVFRKNLFVTNVGEKGLWLRYHHLFRDFLQSHLMQENPQEERRILQQLAYIYGQRGEWEKAHALYQRLGTTTNLANLIEMAGMALIKHGRMSTLASWIDALPADELTIHPVLLSLRGGVAVMLGEVERGLALLNHSEGILREQSDMQQLADTLLRRALAYRFLGKYQESLADIDEVLALAGSRPEMRPLLADGLRSRAMSLHRLGRSMEAIDCLKEAATVYDSLGNAETVAAVRGDLGIIYHSLGDFNQARYSLDSALKFWRKIGDRAREATMLNNVGVLNHYLGDYAHALELLEQALSAAEQSGYIRAQALTLTSIGDVYRDLDASDAASRAYQQAFDLAERINDRFLLFYLLQSEVVPASQRGEYGRAEELLEKARSYAADSRSVYEDSLCSLQAGRLALARHELDKACRELEAATEGFVKSSQQAEEVQARLYLALARYRTQDIEGALCSLADGFNHAANLENPHALVVAGRELKPLLENALSDAKLGGPSRDLLERVVQFEDQISSLRRRLRRQASAVPFTPPRLAIRALGRSQVLVDGRQVSSSAWQTPIARDLLFLLLSHPDGMTKEAIGSIFWPDSSPNQLKLQFKNTIYRLRHALEVDAIVLQDDIYVFNPALDYEYDVETFSNRLAQATSTNDRAKEIAALRTATRLYKGPFMPESEGTWLLVERERLAKTYKDAMVRLIERHLDMGEYTLALDFCQELLSSDPCLEEAHRLAMRAHAATGNKAAVVRQYERCQQSLLKEVNLPPSPQTNELFQSLVH